MLEQAKVYLLLGDTYMEAKKTDKAMIHFNRACSLSEECAERGLKHNADGCLGIAKCYIRLSLYKSAANSADKARYIFEDLDDAHGLARAYQVLEACYAEMQDSEKANVYREKRFEVERENELKIKRTYDLADRAENAMINTTAEKSKKIPLEIVTPLVPKYRRQIAETKENIVNLNILKVKLEAELKALEERLPKIQSQLDFAMGTGALELDSDLIHGTTQRFLVDELIEKLEEEKFKTKKDIEEQKKEVRRVKIRIGNAEDDLSELNMFLEAEMGNLMKKVAFHRILRCGSLNMSNVRTNDVLGTATGGVEHVVCSMEDALYFFDSHEGTLLSYIPGDAPGRHIGPLEGHHGTITCLAFSEEKIYSGGIDCEIRCWDMITSKCLFVCQEGHEASIWAITITGLCIVTGAADKRMCIWDKSNGALLKSMLTHQRAVRCLDASASAHLLVTGSADFEIKIWNVEYVKTKQRRKFDDENRIVGGDFTVNVALKKRLVGQGCSVTAISLKATEIVSGGSNGVVILWDISSASILRKFEGHTGPIRAIQFDAARVVSGSADGDVRVFDVANGKSLITLRGHKKGILDLQYDTDMVLTLSADGTMRRWYWNGVEPKARNMDKYHMLGPGETVNTLAKRYGTTAQTIIKWNKIKDTKKLYIGMRLVVRKGMLRM